MKMLDWLLIVATVNHWLEKQGIPGVFTDYIAVKKIREQEKQNEN